MRLFPDSDVSTAMSGLSEGSLVGRGSVVELLVGRRSVVEVEGEGDGVGSSLELLSVGVAGGTVRVEIGGLFSSLSEANKALIWLLYNFANLRIHQQFCHCCIPHHTHSEIGHCAMSHYTDMSLYFQCLYQRNVSSQHSMAWQEQILC